MAPDGDARELTIAVAGIDRDGWQGPVRPELVRTGPAIIGVRAVLRGFADAMDANWQGTTDHLDDEFLHDLRVAVRRTRSLLAQARRVLPKDVRREQRDAFRWLGATTSPARDLDVFVAGWGELTTLLDDGAGALEPVLAHLLAQRAVAHTELARALTSPHAGELRVRWRAWLDLPDEEVGGGRGANEPLGVILGRRFLAAQEQVLARGRAIDATSPATELHELRKDGKRLRYLLEAFGHLGGHAGSKQVIRHLKKLQDNLGAHQDAEVQAARLRRALHELSAAPQAGSGGSVAATAAGERVAVTLDARQVDARAEFEERFAAYDRKKVHRAVTELVERMSR